MRILFPILLIALAIIFCLITSSDGTTTDKSNLVKRAQDSPYKATGLYSYKHKKKKNKNKNKDKTKEDKSYSSKRHIKRDDKDPDHKPDPVKREEAVTGVLSTEKVNPGASESGSHP